MTDEQLKPCPKCGTVPQSGYMGDEDGGYGYVECPGNGDGHFCGVHADDEAEAIAAWNTRLPSTQADDEVREALEALNAHFEIMQRTAERWLHPGEAYEDRAGVMWSDGDPEPFAADMIWLLDGPQQREAQTKARAALAKVRRG